MTRTAWSCVGVSLADRDVQPLRFFPHYEQYLLSGPKTTTLRMGKSSQLQAGDEVLITIGREPED
jgi:hypothetical protein